MSNTNISYKINHIIRTLIKSNLAVYFLNIWFALLPIFVIAFYIHWYIMFNLRGVNVLSPYTPIGNQSNISQTESLWLFIEIFSIAILWFSSVIIICVTIHRHKSMRFKYILYIATFILSPILCPLYYFIVKKKKHS
jgi:hypothetical protein